MTQEQLKFSLDQIAATDLPIYVSELDLDAEGTNPENKQLTRYQTLFPVMWEHPNVAGITLWGYVKDHMWRESAYLVYGEGIGANERSAMQWIKNYVTKSNTGCDNTGPVLSLELEDLEFSIYPNPVVRGSDINLITNKDITSIEIRSMEGELVLSKFIDSESNNLKINLKEGIYIVEVHRENGKKLVRKLLVR